MSHSSLRFFIGILTLAGCEWSRTEQAALTGVIRDAQGQPVPGAEIRVQQDETGLRRNTQSSGSGVYFLGALPIGTYSVLVSRDGLEKC